MAVDVHGDFTFLEFAVLPEGDAAALGIDEVGILVACRAPVQPDLLLVILARADLQLLDRQVELDSELLLAQEAAVLIQVVRDDVLEDYGKLCLGLLTLTAADVGCSAPIGPLCVRT